MKRSGSSISPDRKGSGLGGDGGIIIINSNSRNAASSRRGRSLLCLPFACCAPFTTTTSSQSNPRLKSTAAANSKRRSTYFLPLVLVGVGIFLVFTMYSRQQHQQGQPGGHFKVTKNASTSSSSSDESVTKKTSSIPVLASTKSTIKNQEYLRAEKERRKREQEKLKQQMKTQQNENDDDSQCGIFLAPSSLKGMPTYGIFTTRDIPNGTDIFNGAPNGPAIPLFDVLAGSSRTLVPKREDDGHSADSSNQLTVSDWGNDDYDDAEQRQFWLAIFNNYWWGMWNTPDFALFEADTVVDYQITTGIFPNHHCVLASIDFDYPDDPYDDSMVNRNQDAAAGAFSYHMGRHYTVSRDIKAGDELFLDYVDCERNATLERAWEQAVPKTDEYFEAADLVWKYYQQYVRNKENPSVHMAGAFGYDQQTGKLVVKDPSTSDPRVMALLPRTKSDFLTLMSRINVRYYDRDELIIQLATMATIEPRTPEWIRENGLCLEHLKPGLSNLPQAGQGGIAQHHIAKGEIIVPSPMLHILDKRILEIYDNQGVDSERKQLLMNYCLGHEESSLLLCPTTNAILINHCSTRQNTCGPNGPNAQFEWSTPDKDKNPWLQMTVDEMAQQAAHRAAGLAMNVVATRGIEPEEEVFVDYGSAWEQAWDSHVANWKPPEGEERIEPWISAKVANENAGPILPELICRDIRHEMDHPYLFTACQYWVTDEDSAFDYRKPNKDWENQSDDEIMNTYADDGSQFEDFESITTQGGNLGYWPCSVLLEEDDADEDEDENDDDGFTGGTYTVTIHQSDFYDSTPWNDNQVPRILYNYPRAGIRYFVRPYASDQHLLHAFRHEIGIRDEIFPPQWKNLPSKNNRE